MTAREVPVPKAPEMMYVKEDYTFFKFFVGLFIGLVSAGIISLVLGV